ncbi:glutamine synthetase 1 [Tropilaelaps mercedesae]|uniref:glutamine synthetase n=1 Tax=Tropilaelaps mercedesae TaxID=418985 RepID=A0A1V9XQ97_9ACAR|nr:glutamine synthetase 1 [Tropilaelaps mercedesae]
MAEDYGVVVTLNPKPMSGELNGAGRHVNFFVEYTRADGGITVINAAIEKLLNQHKTYMENYHPRQGKDNERRLTGNYETSSGSFLAQRSTLGEALPRLPTSTSGEPYIITRPANGRRQLPQSCKWANRNCYVRQTLLRFAPGLVLLAFDSHVYFCRARKLAFTAGQHAKPRKRPPSAARRVASSNLFLSRSPLKCFSGDATLSHSAAAAVNEVFP